jgi:hypothetical protein
MSDLTFTVPWSALCSDNRKFISGQFILSKEYRESKQAIGLLSVAAARWWCGSPIDGAAISTGPRTPRTASRRGRACGGMTARCGGSCGASARTGPRTRRWRGRWSRFGPLTDSRTSPILAMMPTPRWDDPDSFQDRLPTDYNARGVFADGPQPPTNPLGRLQGGRAADASRQALPANVARAALSRVGKVRQKLKLALFVHKPKPPARPIVTSVHNDPAPVSPSE